MFLAALSTDPRNLTFFELVDFIPEKDENASGLFGNMDGDVVGEFLPFFEEVEPRGGFFRKLGREVLL